LSFSHAAAPGGVLAVDDEDRLDVNPVGVAVCGDDHHQPVRRAVQTVGGDLGQMLAATAVGGQGAPAREVEDGLGLPARPDVESLGGECGVG